MNVPRGTGTRPVCSGCGCEIDPEYCHCGDRMDNHDPMWSGHSPIPMGCQCGRDTVAVEELDTGSCTFTDCVFINEAPPEAVAHVAAIRNAQNELVVVGTFETEAELRTFLVKNHAQHLSTYPWWEWLWHKWLARCALCKDLKAVSQH